MKCHKCGKMMKYLKGMKFNEYSIDGWKCSCGEIYYDPEQAQKVLLLNKLKKEEKLELVEPSEDICDSYSEKSANCFKSANKTQLNFKLGIK